MCILITRILHSKDATIYTPMQYIQEDFQANPLRDAPTNICILLAMPNAKHLTAYDFQDTLNILSHFVAGPV